jgi:PAS domain S-box-containing protein
MIKILAIDDNSNNLVVLSALFSNSFSDALIITALSGREGIEKAIIESPDVILLDLVMPVMDGIETCRRLKDDNELKLIPIIMITATQTDSKTRAKALETGVEAFLSKPIDEAELTAQVSSMIRLKQSENHVRLEKERLEEQVRQLTQELENEQEKRKTAEETIRLLNEFDQSLLKTIPFGMDIVDEHGNILFLSDRLKQHFGDDSLGKKCWDLYRDDKIQCSDCPLHSGITIGETETIETNGVLGGKTFDIYHTGMIFNGQKAMLEAFINITERKQAEQFIEKSEEKYRTIFENVQDVFFQTDLNGIVLEISPSIKYFSEFNREEIIGFPVANLYYNPDDREILLNAIKITGELRDYELMLKTKTGNVKYVSINASLISDPDGKPVHINGAIRDITERKWAEEAMRTWNARFIKLSENAPGLIFQFTRRPDGTYYVPVASEGIKDIFGCSPEDVIDDFAPIGRVIYPGDSARVISDIEYSAEHLSYFTSEFRVQIPGREIQWIYSKSTPERLPDGSITWYGFNTDITHKKHAEEALKKSETEFRLLAESMPQIVWITDSYGWNIYFNHQWEEYTGQSLKESYGHGWKTPFHPDEQQFAWNAWQNATKNGTTYSIECRLRRADGVYKWWLIRGTPVMDENGTILKWFGTCTDIDELKDSEEKLRESEQKLRDITYSMADWIWEVDTHGVYTYSSEMGFDHIGFSREEIIGKTPFDFMTPVEAKRMSAILTEIIKKKAPIKDLENWNIKKNGDRVCLLTNGVPILDKEGDLKGYRGVDKDITERKQKEKEILDLNRDLELRVKQRTAELEAANIELESFSYSVSHDLKAPLRHINGFIGLFMENKSTELTAEENEYLKKVTDSATEMGKLIDALLSFSRLNQAELRKTRIHSSVMVQKIIKFFEPEIQNRKITFRVESLPDIEGDKDLIHQVWTNLISNAIKYTIKKPEVNIEIGSVSTGNETTFFIKDNGAGFNMKYAEKLFGVFQRLHKSTDFEGVGIGLANVNRIVMRHGGHCRAEGRPDKGATFYFSLPS